MGDYSPNHSKTPLNVGEYSTNHLHMSKYSNNHSITDATSWKNADMIITKPDSNVIGSALVAGSFT